MTEVRRAASLSSAPDGRRNREPHSLHETTGLRRRALRRGGCSAFLRRRRNCTVRVDGVHVRGASIRKACAAGRVFGDFVERLNGFAFFWPGDEEGSVRGGDGRFKRYASECSAVIRARSADLFDTLAPRFRCAQ